MKTCYLSKPPAKTADAVIGILRENNVGLVADTYSPLSSEVDALSLSACDFFVGILDGSRSDYRVLHEAGIAVGLKKPVALVVPPLKNMPFELAGCTVIRARLTERLALDLHLSAFLAAPPDNIFDLASKRQSRPLTQRPQFGKRSINELKNFHSEIEKEVFDVIIRNGGRVVSGDERLKRDSYRPDFLASFGSTDVNLPINVAIEVKGSISSGGTRDVEEYLYRFLMASGVEIGLVLVPHRVSVQTSYRSGKVFWMTISEFDHYLSRGDLGRFLASERNRLLHGGV